MKSREFLSEVLSSNSCPENFESLYSEFQTYQSATAAALRALHNVCIEDGIPYQLAYGSLLGVVRDGGQIPWDYDIDVFVPFSAKNDLVKALKSDLDDSFYVYCPETDTKCRHYIMRITPRGFRSEALHVDVFYFTGAPDDLQERKLFVNRIKRLSNYRYGRLVNIAEESRGNLRRYLSLVIKHRIPSLFVPINMGLKEYNRLCLQYPLNESSICVSADKFADWYELPTDIMMNTSIIESDFGDVSVPNDSHQLLTMIYGDYLKIPSLQQRIDEVVRSTTRIRYYSRV